MPSTKMKSQDEIIGFALDFVQKHKSATLESIEYELEIYCKDGDIPYIMGDAVRTDTVSRLKSVAKPEYQGFAKNLISCIEHHPLIQGAYGVGTHADVHASVLNNSVVTVIGYATCALEYYDTHQ